MTGREWVASRTPAVPAPLLEALDAAVDLSGPLRPELFMDAGRAQLRAAADRTGRVRSSAFSLLLADALITWACEVAVESDAPDDVLRECLRLRGEA